MEYYQRRSRGYLPTSTRMPYVMRHQVGAEFLHLLNAQKAEMGSGRVKAADDDDDVILRRVQNILSAPPCMGVPPEPSAILPDLYIGTTADSDNLRVLRANHISFILNCAGGNPTTLRRLRELYLPETGIMGYEELPLEDKEDFQVGEYFERARAFIDYGRGRRGRVLVVCPGVSRAGVITMAYLISSAGHTLLQAVRAVKDKRRVALCNQGFMRELIQHARDRGKLDFEFYDEKTKTSTMETLDASSRFNRYRINETSIPRIITKAY